MTTLQKIKISQSSVKAYAKALNPFEDACQLAWWREYIEKDRRREPGDAMLKGLLFEDILIGATRGRDIVKEMIPRVGIKDLRPSKSSSKKVKIDYLLSKNVDEMEISHLTAPQLQEVIDDMEPDMTKGELPKAFQEVEALAQYHRGDIDGSPSIFDKLGIIIDQVQPEISHEIDGVTFEAHPDLGAIYQKELCWIDIKYTDTKEDDRWNGWGDPESIDHTQAFFYVWLWEKMTGEFIPFYYLVFGKSGWIKFLRVDIDEDSMALFESQLFDHATDLKSGDFTPEPIGKFNVCRECPYLDDCDKATRIPNLETIST